MQPHVARISIAPVKALGLLHPDEVSLDAHGVTGDRRFWLLDEDGRLFNNKRNGPILQIRPEWDEDTRELALTFPDGRRVEGIVELGDTVEPVLHRVTHPSQRVLGPWDAALSEYAGKRLQLLWSNVRATDRGVRGGTVSLVSRASLERLREQAGEDAPVDGRRFRMLFEIDGVTEHEEDEWLGSQVRVGEATLSLNGDVGRCLATSRNPDTGVVDLDTLGVLAGYRREGRSEPLPFGVYGSVAVPGRVRVGDPIARVL